MDKDNFDTFFGLDAPVDKKLVCVFVYVCIMYIYRYKELLYVYHRAINSYLQLQKGCYREDLNTDMEVIKLVSMTRFKPHLH